MVRQKCTNYKRFFSFGPDPNSSKIMKFGMHIFYLLNTN